MTNENLQLIYTLLCDDVRLEMGNKISMMGVFQNIMVEKLPRRIFAGNSNRNGTPVDLGC
jgi:hypothetical protein